MRVIVAVWIAGIVSMTAAVAAVIETPWAAIATVALYLVALVYFTARVWRLAHSSSVTPL